MVLHRDPVVEFHRDRLPQPQRAADVIADGLQPIPQQPQVTAWLAAAERRPSGHEVESSPHPQ